MSKNKQKKKGFKAFIIRLLFYGIVTGVICLLLLILLVRIGVFGKLPTEADLQQIQNNTATEILSVDNQLLGRYYYENRTNARIEDIPTELINALIATEDARFYKHNGVDRRSSLRVLIKSLLFFNKSSGGGSTISQQLAKNLYPRHSYSFLTLPVAKIKEINIAKRIEKLYSKEEILELYLNTVSFGENTYGIETASIIFFNKKPKDLKIEESALLIGLLKANSSYNPRTNKEAAKERRNTVLSQMVKYNYLTKDEADSLMKIDIKLNYRRLTHNEGPAPYLRESLRQDVKNILDNIKKSDGSKYNLYADGLKIYTTINYKMQNYAETSMKKHMTELQKTFDKHWHGREPWKKNPELANQQIKQSEIYKLLKGSGFSHQEILDKMKSPHKTHVFNWNGEKDTTISSLDSVLYHFKTLQTGVLVMNGFNGDVLTWIGGIDYKYFQYDHVTAKRQAGSTFKPIVYAKALELGREPCDFYANDSVVYKDFNNWTPENADREYGGFYSMKGALANSVNTVSVKILMENGIDKTIELAKNMGINSELPEYPSLALGTGEISLYELVQAYCVFLNKGHPVEPRIIRRIEDSKGNVIYSDPAHIPGESIITEETAQTMLAMLQQTVKSGTAHGLQSIWGLNNELAGKTGTTQDQADGWFIGLNPRMVIGVWVGGDYPSVRFRSTTYGQGSYAAMPICANFLTKLYKDPVYKYLKGESFDIPDEIYAKLECDDFSDEYHEKRINIKFDETDIGGFIKKIFGRKKNKENEEVEN